MPRHPWTHLKLVVNEGPPLPEDPLPAPAESAPELEFSGTPRPYYELSHAAGSPPVRRPNWLAVLDEVRRWPRGTRFTVTLWVAPKAGAAPAPLMFWRLWQGRSGRWHSIRMGGVL
ncbi:MAG TPA: hypothetical protein VKY26_11535 [Actinomycetota bacterium]|nr:hypothetical protein [Actinomycetota bacterium]